MNPVWQRAQELQRAINQARSGRGEGRRHWLYLALGNAREQLASERLANHNAQGWVDRLAAITAYALAGTRVRAERLWSASREQAESWAVGGALLAEQHTELEFFLKKQALDPVGVPLLGATSSNDVDHILRLVRAQWPQGVVDSGDGEAPHRFDIALKGRRLAPCDFSLHETREAYDSWATQGPTEANVAQMVLVIVERGRVCFVADDQAPEAHGLVHDMVAALKENRWLANATRWPASAPAKAA